MQAELRLASGVRTTPAIPTYPLHESRSMYVLLDIDAFPHLTPDAAQSGRRDLVRRCLGYQPLQGVQKTQLLRSI